MAELSPPGFNNMVRPSSLPGAYKRGHNQSQFFGLFGLSNHASSMIGPNVIQEINNKSDNNRDGFPFPFALCTSASLVIWFTTDVQK